MNIVTLYTTEEEVVKLKELGVIRSMKETVAHGTVQIHYLDGLADFLRLLQPNSKPEQEG